MKEANVPYGKKQSLPPEGSFRKTSQPLLDLLKQWIAKGYFKDKRTALEIYKKLNEESILEFKISDLEKCLKILCSSSQHLLQKNSIDGVLMYWEK